MGDCIAAQTLSIPSILDLGHITPPNARPNNWGSSPTTACMTDENSLLPLSFWTTQDLRAIKEVLSIYSFFMYHEDTYCMVGKVSNSARWILWVICGVSTFTDECKVHTHTHEITITWSVLCFSWCQTGLLILNIVPNILFSNITSLKLTCLPLETKWPSFHRRYFDMHFSEWKVLYFD